MTVVSPNFSLVSITAPSIAITSTVKFKPEAILSGSCSRFKQLSQPSQPPCTFGTEKLSPRTARSVFLLHSRSFSRYRLTSLSLSIADFSCSSCFATSGVLDRHVLY
ncbi:hypothetical protein PPL_03617 [Heterostelium album PN500]|uniref:Uncharacterized protein n=1 Tax=Heterostelium pallidum (strain ATCC 26659 / Pp 5 / PN500) TaxID=670386 RepID=D3B5A4_HETP5|nr:hypothetical protein PPL_03617 [Heterostelium album PN500]EFA83469.1 hypothetical protein PPL_03617 [Heterostelium album PN500]|eukprot:XP_020435586.1 hypothetical protein PPL_03617 [Heterostelium album PN500]